LLFICIEIKLNSYTNLNVYHYIILAFKLNNTKNESLKLINKTKKNYENNY